MPAFPGKTSHKPRQGASSGQPDLGDLSRSYAKHHLLAAVASAKRLLEQPLATLMTVAVLAIALMLPTALWVGLSNVQAVSEGWQGATRVSVYLAEDLSEQAGRDLAEQLAANDQIESLTYMSRQDVLAEFKQYSGLAAAVDYLGDNPLPAVIVIEPSRAYLNKDSLQQLRLQLQSLEGVDDAEVDMAWLERLLSIIDLARQLVLGLAALLVIAVLLVVGNTIRLEIENRRDEIQVVKLVGGTDAFVRRPFLYTGFWYGLTAGLLAWLLIVLSTWALSGAVSRLALLYQSDFSLQGLDGSWVLLLLASSMLVGIAGAWLAVLRHLRAIEP